MKGVWYFNGDSLIINDTGCPKGKFWITCAESFFYLLINTNFDFEFLEKAEIEMYDINPIISTYYIECDEKSFEDLINKYCTKDARSSLMSDSVPESQLLRIKKVRLIHIFLMERSAMKSEEQVSANSRKVLKMKQNQRS